MWGCHDHFDGCGTARLGCPRAIIFPLLRRENAHRESKWPGGVIKGARHQQGCSYYKVKRSRFQRHIFKRCIKGGYLVLVPSRLSFQRSVMAVPNASSILSNIPVPFLFPVFHTVMQI